MNHVPDEFGMRLQSGGEWMRMIVGSEQRSAIDEAEAALLRTGPAPSRLVQDAVYPILVSQW